MSLSRHGPTAVRPVMNVTPLVDIVLVLLIIFMVVLPAMNEGENVEVPGIFHADPEQENAVDPFVLSVQADGAMFLDDQPIPADNAEAYLRSANAREPGRRVVLRGDRNLSYQRARELMRMFQNMGFPGVQLRVKEAAGAGDPVIE